VLGHREPQVKYAGNRKTTPVHLKQGADKTVLEEKTRTLLCHAQFIEKG